MGNCELGIICCPSNRKNANTNLKDSKDYSTNDSHPKVYD